MSHQNSGNCAECVSIFNKYPGPNITLFGWFFDVQSKIPEFHASCVGRGQIDQEACFARGATRAHWTQSSHNFNCAVDTWFLIDGQYHLEEIYFKKIIPFIIDDIAWYGDPHSNGGFYERPHYEMKNWHSLVVNGLARLVE